MKRLLGLSVLFVVLCMCVPSYGNHSLIYNVSGAVKGINNNASVSIPWKGYLVVTLSDSSAFLDANLIMYGQNSAKKKVYIEHGYKETDVNSLGVVHQVHDTFLTFDFTCDTADFYFEGYILGKVALIDVGRPVKKLVAAKPSGTMIVRGLMIFDQDDDVEGTSAVSCSLWTAATKYVNSNSWTVNQIIDTGDGSYKGLIPQLVAKGYSKVEMP